MQGLKLDRFNSELFTNKASNQLVQGFACGCKNEAFAGPVQLKTGGLRGNPDLARGSLWTDHDLAGIRVVDFNRQDPVLDHNLGIITFGDNIQSMIQAIECRVELRTEFGFGQNHGLYYRYFCVVAALESAFE